MKRRRLTAVERESQARGMELARLQMQRHWEESRPVKYADRWTTPLEVAALDALSRFQKTTWSQHLDSDVNTLASIAGVEAIEIRTHPWEGTHELLRDSGAHGRPAQVTMSPLPWRAVAKAVLAGTIPAAVATAPDRSHVDSFTTWEFLVDPESLKDPIASSRSHAESLAASSTATTGKPTAVIRIDSGEVVLASLNVRHNPVAIHADKVWKKKWDSGWRPTTNAVETVVTTTCVIRFPSKPDTNAGSWLISSPSDESSKRHADADSQVEKR